jgi:hypothetical protein
LQRATRTDNDADDSSREKNPEEEEEEEEALLTKQYFLGGCCCVLWAMWRRTESKKEINVRCKIQRQRKSEQEGESNTTRTKEKEATGWSSPLRTRVVAFLVLFRGKLEEEKGLESHITSPPMSPPPRWHCL